MGRVLPERGLEAPGEYPGVLDQGVLAHQAPPCLHQLQQAAADPPTQLHKSTHANLETTLNISEPQLTLGKKKFKMFLSIYFSVADPDPGSEIRDWVP